MNKPKRISVPPDVSKADQFAKEAAKTKPGAEKEPVVRFTLDLPESLWQRAKMAALMQRRPLSKMIRELIEREFPPEA